MEKYKIIELDIDPELSADTGVWEVAWVESPAIEQELIYFNRQEFDSYSDYPESVSNNAKRGIELNEKIGNKCATQVGKVRAQQLANGEPVSLETIKRMYSYLSRAETYYDEGDTEACGTISYLLWGGLSAKRWSESKLKELDEFNKLEGFEMDATPCWSGYEMIGMKEKDGRMVPNCVKMKQEEFVYPEPGESENDFISRCVKYVMAEGLTQDQALGKCYGMLKQGFAATDVSFDWDGTLTTDRGVRMLEDERRRGSIIHIISARPYPTEDMFDLMRKYDIPSTHLHTVGSNQRKVELVKRLGIKRHYDNNPQVLRELGEVGMNFDYDISNLPTYENYPTGDTKNNMLVEPVLMSEDCGCSETKYFSNLVCGIDGSCYDEYSSEEIEVLSILEELRQTSPMEFEAVVGQLRGSTESEIMMRAHKKPVFYFKYARILSGSPDRDFCTSIENRYFRRFEIDLLQDTNKEFGHNQQGYSKWLYKGGPNCVHAWQRFIFTPPSKKNPAQLKDLGMVSGNPGIPPKSMPNNGYYSEATKRKSEIAYIISQQNMSEQKVEHFKTNEEKRLVYMPLMIPNILIPRYDELTRERYWVKFTPKSIERIRDKFHFELRLRDTNLEHTDKKFQDAIMVESWIVDGPQDKAYSLGFTEEQIPYGTWMSAYKVLETEQGDEIWDKYIKSGKVRGASVEGNFLLKFSDTKNDEYLLEQVINILNQID